MRTVKLLIAGSRGLDPSIEEIDSALEEFGLFPSDIASLVCGMADGVDLAGKRWADHNDIKVDPYPPDYKKFGKEGAIIRNQDMAEMCDAGLVFWDGRSPSSANMIANLAVRRKPMWVVDMKKLKKEKSLIVSLDGAPHGVL